MFKNIFTKYCLKHEISIKDFSINFEKFAKIKKWEKYPKLHMLYFYNQGIRRPSLDSIIKIEEFTNNEISIKDFCQSRQSS